MSNFTMLIADDDPDYLFQTVFKIRLPKKPITIT